MIIYIYVYQKDGCIKSRMKGDFHVRFCEKLGLQCPCLLDRLLPAVFIYFINIFSMSAIIIGDKFNNSKSAFSSHVNDCSFVSSVLVINSVKAITVFLLKPKESKESCVVWETPNSNHKFKSGINSIKSILSIFLR